MVLPVTRIAGPGASRRRQQLLRALAVAGLTLAFLGLSQVQRSMHSRHQGGLPAVTDGSLRREFSQTTAAGEQLQEEGRREAEAAGSGPPLSPHQSDKQRLQRYRRAQQEERAQRQQQLQQRSQELQLQDQEQQQQASQAAPAAEARPHPAVAQQLHHPPWAFEDEQEEEPRLGAGASKLLLARLEPDGGSAAGAVVNMDVYVIAPERPAGDLRTAIELNSQRRLQVPVPSAGVNLADIRVPLAAALGLPRDESSFRFLVWSASGSCLQPLGRWEEAHEAPGTRSGGHLLVARNSALGLPDSQQWAPLNILFWRRHPELPPNGHLASIATGGLAAGLVCRRWGAEQHLHGKVARERSFWVGLDKPPPLGGRNENWAVETMGRDAMQYFGWHEMGVAKSDAAIVIRGGWDWSTIFASTRPGLQLIMRHPHNNNLTAKDLLYWNLRNQARASGACIPLEKMVPQTFLTDDPEDCKRLREAMRKAPQGTTWVRKVADLHVGQGITPLQDLKPGDCSRSAGGFVRSSKVVYQGRMEPLKMNGRPISLRSYVLVASLEPMVLAFNHHAGHVYIAGEQVMQSSKAWYTQHHSFEAWTFERFDEWLTTAHGKTGFFRNYTLPQMKDAILAGIKSARGSFTETDPPVHGSTDAAGNRIWDTGHSLGPLGNFDLWCIDFMYDTDFEMRMLEMTDSCIFKGYREQEQVRQRVFMMKDSLELTVAIQSRVLQHEPIADLFPTAGWRGAPTTRSGNFELLYSEVPGSEYDFFKAEERCYASH